MPGFDGLVKSHVASSLRPLLTGKGETLAEYRKRKSPHLYQSVHPSREQEMLEAGWQIVKKGKLTTRLSREKTHDRQLEDRVWCLFYLMGYPQIGGERFKIQYERADGSVGEKQIDLFCKDDETVVIGECKSKKDRGKRTLQKDLHETEALQKQLANAVRKHYGSDFNPKIIWIYVTNNIIWSEPDVERADAAGVRIVTENELQYYEAFIKHMGPAGRFQFLAEFLKDQKIPSLSEIKVPAVKGKLGGHTFYSFVTTPRHLLKIAYVNHQALNHPDGRPAYQRMITRNRIKGIGDYIKGGGYFPTNILVNFTEECRFDPMSNKENSEDGIKHGTLYLPNKYKSAWIIDGQHRLYGFSHLDEAYWDDSLFVLAFEQMDVKTEAELFVTINHKQKSVPPGVLVALKADLKWGSADPKERVGALASALIKSMSSDMTSPLFQRFVTQGVSPKEDQNLTISEAVNGLNRSGLLGKVLHKNYVPGALCGATDEKTILRARKFLNAYFGKVREAAPVRWDAARAGFISVNPGIRAHLLLIAEALKLLSLKGVLDIETAPEQQLMAEVEKVISPYLEYIKSASDDEIVEKFSRRFGEGGVVEYYFLMCEIIHAHNSEFGSDDFKKWVARKGDERVSQADKDIINLTRVITDAVFDKLKHLYGTHQTKSGEAAYWELGIESTKAKEEAYKRQLSEPVESRLPKEAYVDIIELMKIVRQKNNWDNFKDVFNLKMSGEQNGKTYYLDWMEVFNKLRRIPAHSSSLRNYEDADYEFLAWLKGELSKRLPDKKI